MRNYPGRQKLSKIRVNARKVLAGFGCYLRFLMTREKQSEKASAKKFTLPITPSKRSKTAYS